jgi:hypothetical protein
LRRDIRNDERPRLLGSKLIEIVPAKATIAHAVDGKPIAGLNYRRSVRDKCCVNR